MAWAKWRQRKHKQVVLIGWTDETERPRQKATKCKTLKEGKALAEKLEQAAELVRLGIEKPRQKDVALFEATDVYLKSLPPDYASINTLRGRLAKINRSLGTKPLRSITPADVKAVIYKDPSLSPQTREHYRVALQGLFSHFVDDLRWRDLDNVASGFKVPVPTRDPAHLSPSDLLKLFEEIPKQWRIAFVVSVSTALRKGELLGLLKSDVKLEAREIIVRRSHARETTKTGRARHVPIPESLVPYLEEQLRTKGDLLFANPKGGRWSKTVRLHDVIARALGRAGFVTGYELRCRRQGCGFKSPSAAPDKTPCPKCGFKLHPRRLPIDFRWKDLRSTWATHAAAMTGDIRFVQAVLGHGDVKTTTTRYAFALPSHLKSQAERVNLGLSRASETQVTFPNSAQFGPSAAEPAQPKPQENQADANQTNRND